MNQLIEGCPVQVPGKPYWMRNVGDKYIEAFATFVVEMSKYIEKEARKYNYEYVEMSNRPLNDVMEKVVGALLQK